MSFIEDLVTSWTSVVFDWYVQTFMVILSPEMLLIQLELLILIYLVLQVLSILFPLVRRAMTAIFLPFRVLHVWLHLQTAQKLGLQIPDPEAHLVINQFLTSITSDDQTALGIKTPMNTCDAYRIATAPTKGAVILIGLSFVLSPILLMFGIIGLFIHLYILLGSLTTLWADGKDYLFAYQVALLNVDLSPRYLGWAVPVFGLSVLSTFMLTTDIARALLTGVGFTVVYLLGLLWVVSRIAKAEKAPVVPEAPPTIEPHALLPFPAITLPSCEE